MAGPRAKSYRGYDANRNGLGLAEKGVRQAFEGEP